MNLSEWLARDPSMAARLRAIAGICQAVNAAHQRNSHFRVLKPATIEVANDGAARVTDFALRGDHEKPAASEDREQAAGYAAPEVVERGRYSAKADIYSAGLIFYEILAGRHPLLVEVSKGLFETMYGIQPPALRDARPDLPADLTDAITAWSRKRSTSSVASSACFPITLISR